MPSKNFALIGAGGYIAPRHMQAIRDTGNSLSIAFDISDSVGILDSYFPEADFHTDFECFAADVASRIGTSGAIDYVAICSPNYLHFPHLDFALRSGADAICEKPLVLDPIQLDRLEELENQTNRKVNTILQLRLHDSVVALKKRIETQIVNNPSKRFDVDLTYLTSRGSWYHASWKGDERRSGGVATNIGIHFFDMLNFLFGDLQRSVVNQRTESSTSGKLTYERADVRWFLSVDANFLPQTAVDEGKRTYRSITVDGEEIEFSTGFTDLHTRSYEHVLSGNGFGIDTAAPSVRLAHEIRVTPVEPKSGDAPMSEQKA